MVGTFQGAAGWIRVMSGLFSYMSTFSELARFSSAELAMVVRLAARLRFLRQRPPRRFGPTKIMQVLRDLNHNRMFILAKFAARVATEPYVLNANLRDTHPCSWLLVL